MFGCQTFMPLHHSGNHDYAYSFLVNCRFGYYVLCLKGCHSKFLGSYPLIRRGQTVRLSKVIHLNLSRWMETWRVAFAFNWCATGVAMGNEVWKFIPLNILLPSLLNSYPTNSLFPSFNYWFVRSNLLRKLTKFSFDLPSPPFWNLPERKKSPCWPSSGLLGSTLDEVFFFVMCGCEKSYAHFVPMMMNSSHGWWCWLGRSNLLSPPWVLGRIELMACYCVHGPCQNLFTEGGRFTSINNDLEVVGGITM